MATGPDPTPAPAGDARLGKLLRTLREQALLTQEELAERAELSVRMLRGVESGRIRQPRSASLRLLADALALTGPDRARLVAAARSAPTEPDPEPAVAGSVPAQLPPDVAGFTGRFAQLQHLDSLLLARDGRGAAVPTVVISGPAGVGKTALVVHWAHRVAGRFPDGQLYVDLRGYDAERPLAPVEVLAGFLHAFGLRGADIPVAADPAVAAYRSQLAGKRVLVVLDNAASAEQVRPLLPAGAGCLTLVTCRDRLGGLVARDGAGWLDLDVLSPAEAHTLLVHMLGAARMRAEPESVAELARLCGYLPLALRIAAANLAVRPRQRIAEQVAQLRDGDRLGGLTVAGDPSSAVVAAFGLSYARLPEPARRLFRLLGLVPGPDVTVPAAAALAGQAAEEVAGVLETLARAHLIEERGTGRYGCHDLLRRYAADRSTEEDAGLDQAAARQRLFDWYLSVAQSMAATLYPQMLRPPGGGAPAASAWPVPCDGPAEAKAWLAAERANLVSTIMYAADHGPRSVAWQLSYCLGSFWWSSGHLVDGQIVATAALAAAARESDLAGRATAHLTLGGVNLSLGSYPQALEHLDAAVELAGQADWTDGRAAALSAGAFVDARQGRLDRAAARLTEARELDLGRPGRLAGLATTANTLGGVYQDLGQLAQAAECFTESVASYRQLRAPGSAYAIPLCNLGGAARDLGRLDEASQHVSEALAISRQERHRLGESAALATLATVHCEAGRYAEALDAAQAAASLASEIGYQLAVVIAGNTLGTIHRCGGHPQRALDHHRRALEQAGQVGERAHELDARLGLAAAHRDLGEHDRALQYARRVLQTARELGYRLREGRALTILAEIHLDRGDHQPAREYAELALKNHRQTGHRPGQARADRLLDTILVSAHAADGRG